MTETEQEQTKTQLLKSKNQYPGWIYIIQTKLMKKKLMTTDYKLLRQLKQRLGNSSSKELTTSKEVLENLEQKFLGKSKQELKKAFQDVKMIGINPIRFLEELQTKYTEALAGGITISLDDRFS